MMSEQKQQGPASTPRFIDVPLDHFNATQRAPAAQVLR